MKNLFLLLAWTTPFALFSQQYPLTIIDYNDGLARSSIYEVIKDKQGYMWLASDASVVRYDGEIFNYYSFRDGFSGNYVLDIDIDNQNRLWLSTYGGGVAWFDGTRFHSYNTTNGFPANYVRSTLFTSFGEVWAATEDMGIIRKKHNELPEVLYKKDGSTYFNTWSLIEDKIGNIWTAGIDGVLCFEKINNYKPVLIYNTGFTITSVSEDPKGFIWAAGAYSFARISSDTIIDYGYLLPSGTIVLDMLADSDKIYLASVGGLITIKNDTLSFFDKSNGVANHQFWDIYKDENNEIWLSSGGGGVVKYDKRGVAIYDRQNDISFESMILDIVESNDGRIIFSTELNGYFYFENGQFKKYEDPTISKILSSYSTGYDRKSGTLALTSTTGGIYWMKNNQLIHSYEPDKVDVKIAYGIDFIDSLKLMVLSDDGCYTLSLGMKKMERMKEIPEVFCRSVFRDNKGNSWILGDKGEVFKWNAGNVEEMHDLINPERYNFLEGYYDAVNDLYWFCTNSGLIVWDGLHSIVLHSKNGLNSDLPVSITQDKWNRIWVGHDKGLSCIDVSKKEIKYISHDQGFKTISANLKSIEANDKGELWVGSAHYMYNIDILNLIPKNKHTRLRLQEISSRNDIYFKENYFQDSIISVDLDYDENNFQIKLCGLDFVNSQNVQYSWMLKGYDKDFMPYTFSNEAGYTNLPGGDYEFIAKAIDSDGYETNTISAFIHIEKPFWEKVWFYILEIAIFGIIVFLSFTFSSRSSSNRFGQVMTFLTIIILFESAIFYLSAFINPLTNGIPVFQLVMNIILAAILQPMEQIVKRLMKKGMAKNRE